MLQLERLLRRGGFECFNLARSDYEWIPFVRIISCFPVRRDRDLMRQLFTQIRQVHLHELAYQSIGRTHHVTHWGKLQNITLLWLCPTQLWLLKVRDALTMNKSAATSNNRNTFGCGSVRQWTELQKSRYYDCVQCNYDFLLTHNSRRCARPMKMQHSDMVIYPLILPFIVRPKLTNPVCLVQLFVDEARHVTFTY